MWLPTAALVVLLSLHGVWAAIGNITVDNTDRRAIFFSNGWQHYDVSWGIKPWYNNSYARAVLSTSKAGFTFKGPYIAWWGAWRVNGTCIVNLDGEDQKAVRPDVDGFGEGLLMWERGGLSDTEHTVEVVVGPEFLVDCYVDRFVFTSTDVPAGANLDTNSRGPTSTGTGTTPRSSTTSRGSDGAGAGQSPEGDGGDAPKPNTTNIGPIVGGVVGGTVALLAIAYQIYRFARKSRPAKPAPVSEPSDGDSTAALQPQMQMYSAPPMPPPWPQAMTPTASPAPLLHPTPPPRPYTEPGSAARPLRSDAEDEVFPYLRPELR